MARRRAELEPKVEVLAGVQSDLDPASMPRLRWMQTGGAGNDWLLRSPHIANSDVVLTNGSGVAAIPIAEHVLALMFTLCRNFHGFARAQRDHVWFRGGRLGEVDSSTMGIVGLGAIGEKTAEKAKGLNMHVLGLRRDPTRSSPHVDRMLVRMGCSSCPSRRTGCGWPARSRPRRANLIGDRSSSSEWIPPA